MAAFNGHEGWLRHLLGAGASPHAAYVDGSEPLHVACQQGHAACARALVEAGADPSRLWEGLTAAELAARHGHRDVVSLLARLEAALGAAMAPIEEERDELDAVEVTAAAHVAAAEEAVAAAEAVEVATTAGEVVAAKTAQAVEMAVAAGEEAVEVEAAVVPVAAARTPCPRGHSEPTSLWSPPSTSPRSRRR